MPKNVNKIIFKYRSFNRTSLNILTKKQLWLADPETFNDPFDCRIDYKAALNKTIQKLKSYNSFNIENISNRLESVIQNAKVCCFCNTKKNQLMWAHYADEHKGFCIGFNANDLINDSDNTTTGILPVEYLTKDPYGEISKNLDLLIKLKGDISTPDISDSFLRCALTTKYRGWIYEKEVRIISTKIQTLNFQPKSINSITFGLKMEDKHKHTLKELLSGNEWQHLKWYETVKAKDRYALNFNLI